MKMMRRGILMVCLILSGTAQATRAAQQAMDALEPPVAAGPVAAQPLTEGEVRRVNKESGRLTIKHGEIRNLDMPPMTMSFHVADPAMLGIVKAGEKIRFAVEKVEGKYTVMRLEADQQAN
jgi:Cu(I)/Ag(I) efflux system periplasmic protein CusF